MSTDTLEMVPQMPDLKKNLSSQLQITRETIYVRQFFIAVTNILDEQLTKRKIDFSSWFQSSQFIVVGSCCFGAYKCTVHRGRNARERERRPVQHMAARKQDRRARAGGP